MDKNLIKLFNEGNFTKLEEKLKKLYPQIDSIAWNEDTDGDVDLHIVFVKMPYMLPFSGSSYAHFGDLDGSTYGSGLEKIMSECRVITKDDVKNIDFGSYYSDLVARGYDVDELENSDDHDETLWEVVKQIREDEGLTTLYRVVDAKGKDCIYEGYDYDIASRLHKGYNDSCGDWYIEEEEMED